jgi:protein-S-isoprenylcysteine O-methyltransferase Ste14
MKIRSVILVLVQMICSLGIVFSNGLIPENFFVKILLGVGLLVGVWAMAEFKFRFNIFPELLKNSTLITSGPYRFVRHPIYTAVLMITLAYLINTPKFSNYIMWAVLLIILLVKLHHEETLLRERFSDYEDYTARTKKLVPFVF